jgi:hypothetical protein
MNKTNQGIEVRLSVIAISAILVASLFVMSSSRFMPDAMAQNVTDETGALLGGAANETGAAAGGAANETGAAAGGAANETGAAAGGAANETGAAAGGAVNQSAMVMIPQSDMNMIMTNMTDAMQELSDGNTESAMMALESVDQALRSSATEAGMSMPATGGEDTSDDNGGEDTSDDTSDDNGEDNMENEG